MAARGLALLLIAACATAELRLVSLVFRHGPRTPADTYPNDPYVNYDFAPVGWGQLTNAGKLSQYEQGKWLHQRYGAFLGNTYSPQILVAQSTDVDRTIMSAQLELAGLLPPNEEQRWNPELNWQPIPVHSQPLALDDLLLVRIPCPRYHQELEAIMKSEEVQERLSVLNAHELYANLSQITGLNIQNPDDVQSVYSTLKAEIPSSEDEWKLIAYDFEKTWNYPHCIGAVDGKHIVLQSPKNSGSLFFNYKGSCSIVLMGIADANYCFLYANIGCQGRISDGGVFRQTSFYQKLMKKELALPIPQPLPGSEVLSPYVLVADDAFPLQLHIMKPYPGHQEKGSTNRIYNYRHARARRVVENTFGLLASVFRVFRKPLMVNVENAETITAACVYLHNFLKKSNSSRTLYAPYGTLDIDTQDGTVIPGSWRLVVEDDTGMVNLRRKPRKSGEDAKDVRDEFARYFVSRDGKVPWQDRY